MPSTLYDIEKNLAAYGIEDARREAVFFITHYTGVKEADIYLDTKREYDSQALAAAVKKRASRYPLQYILGKWEFCGLPFHVDESCLIPRQDTEIIAEKAAEYLPSDGILLDLCTGSGCILAAALTLSGIGRSSGRGVGVELYNETAETARRNINALSLGSRAEIIVGDAREDLFPPDVLFDVITANPPYVTTDEMDRLAPELSYEPRHALTDGGDGLAIIRDIIKIYRRHLKPRGIMIIEHGWHQAASVETIAHEYGMAYRCLYDYGKNPRAAILHNET